jgi:hypothetical protein
VSGAKVAAADEQQAFAFGTNRERFAAIEAILDGQRLIECRIRKFRERAEDNAAGRVATSANFERGASDSLQLLRQFRRHSFGAIGCFVGDHNR